MAYTQAELNHYKQHPEEVTSDLDDDLLMELLDYEPENIQRIKPQTRELIQRAYDRDPQIFKFIDFSVITIQFLEEVIKAHPTYIRYIYSPSPEVIKIALTEDINVIPYVDQWLDESMYEWLVSMNGLALQYIPEPQQTIRMTELAIEQNIESYKYAYVKSKETDIYVGSRDSSKIPLLTDYWPELIDQFIEYNPRYITKFYDIPDVVTKPRLKRAIALEPDIYRTVPEPDMDIMKYTLTQDIDLFPYMPYNTELLEATLEVNGLILKYYKKKDLRTIKAALSQNVEALDYVEYPRQFLIDYAFKQDGYALKYLRSPTYEQAYDAVKRNWKAMEFVKDEWKTKDMQLVAINKGKQYVIPFLGEVTHKDVILEVINVEPGFVFKIENPTSEYYAKAFGLEAKLMLFFHDWNERFGFEEIGAALGQDGSIFEYVKYKMKALALIAIEQYPPAIQWTTTFQDLELAKAAVERDARMLYFVRKDILDIELLELALEIDSEYFTKTAGVMTWEQWIEALNLQDYEAGDEL